MSELVHEGVSKRDGAEVGSGRFPLGSGDHPFQRLDKIFLNLASNLKKQGLSEQEIIDGLKLNGYEIDTIENLRYYKTIARERTRTQDYEKALELAGKGMGATAIGKEMGISESSVRSLLNNKQAQKKATEVVNTIDVLEKHLKNKKYLDVSAGNEITLGISETKMKAALAGMKLKGYEIHTIRQDQIGTGHKTTTKVLCQPGTPWKEVINNMSDIHLINEKILDTDGSVKSLDLEKPKSIKSERVFIRYGEEGGTEKDGLIELRRNVPDLSLGKAQYAQVRIGVDDTHYLKGMAVYSDDIPDGYDVIYNVNKSKDKGKMGVMKKMDLEDPTHPFGATIKGEDELKMVQRYYIDDNGKKQLSSINIVNEQGDWSSWSKTLASQVLSKQPVKLAKTQLDKAYNNKKEEFDEIMRYTNPTVQKKLLLSFADGCDSAAVKLKAASLPGQETKVLLPIPSLKDNECYLPTVPEGETVILLRYPHQGQFEIPKLRVTHKNKEALNCMKNATDAIGINQHNAEILSGADFDGDSVTVIPVTRNGQQTIAFHTKDPLPGLKDYDYKKLYALPEGAPVMSEKRRDHEMGVTTNLLTDMTLMGADQEDIEKVVKQAMIVIDSVKHKLDYKRAYVDNDIRNIKKKYQSGGSSTLITRAKSTVRVPERKDTYLIDPVTGERKYINTNRTYTDKNGNTKQATTKSNKMSEAKDARELMSSYALPMERVYAQYANDLKALANEARKEFKSIKELDRSPSAAKTYAKEVESLEKKLTIAKSNKPLERAAQRIAGEILSAKKRDNPDASSDQVSKWRGQALQTARARLGAKKVPVTFTDKEWEAVQAGAISHTKLSQLLNNAKEDHIKELALPRTFKPVSLVEQAKIKALAAKGWSIAYIADSLGRSPSTISEYL